MVADVAGRFAAWVSQTQHAEKERVETLLAFSKQLADLNQKFRDVSKDLERERVAARHTQEESECLKRRLEELQEAIDGSSFVLVLIDADADGYLFKDEYYTDVDGGRKAVLDLEAAVQQYLKTTQPELSSLPIMIRAFANADGLSQLLVKAKLAKSPVSLTGFAKGFTQAMDKSDFVLVGSGKDRADEKIKGLFQQFITNPTCRHIIFGACHDNGYVRALERYQDSRVADRVTLLYPFEPGKEFAKLVGFRNMHLETIFRNEPVTSRNSPPQTHRGLNTEAVRADSRPTPGNPWKTVGSVTPPSVNSRKDNDLPSGAVYVNESGQRIDSELPSPSSAALSSWDHKVKVAKMRYCRKHHLLASCHKERCDFSHGPLTEGEILVYRHKLRLEYCHTGAQCRDQNCFYGHHCACEKQSCKFPREMHHVDLSPRVFPCA